MSNSQLPNAKLIILYILQKIPGISATDLMKQSIDSLYMDYFMFSQAKGANSQAMSFGRSKARLFSASKPSVTFADVAGADEADADPVEQA